MAEQKQEFKFPTETVDLPSGGKVYPKDSPLSIGKIDIKYMTAKEEDILTSQTLLKKGIALDRFLQSIIIDKSINPHTLLVGDKNAIIIAARSSGYGADYSAHINCTQCGAKNYIEFDLRNPEYIGDGYPEELNITKTENGTLITQMPFSKFNVEFRFMNGEDEMVMTKTLMDQRKNNRVESVLTEQYKRMIISVEGHTDQGVIDQYAENMPTIDSRHLKLLLKNITPNIKISKDLNCRECEHVQEVDVPFGTDFFWPDL